MSGFQFAAALVASHAWAATVVGVAVLFRRQLTALLARPFTSLKAVPFARIESQLRQLLDDAELDTGGASALQLARRAQEAGLVQAETVRAIEGIAVLRNLAAHGHEAELDESRALDYLALTDAVSYSLPQESRMGPLT